MCVCVCVCMCVCVCITHACKPEGVWISSRGLCFVHPGESLPIMKRAHHHKGQSHQYHNSTSPAVLLPQFVPPLTVPMRKHMADPLAFGPIQQKQNMLDKGMHIATLDHRPWELCSGGKSPIPAQFPSHGPRRFPSSEYPKS